MGTQALSLLAWGLLGRVTLFWQLIAMNDDAPPDEQAAMRAVLTLTEALWAVKDEDRRHRLLLLGVIHLLETFEFRTMQLVRQDRPKKKPLVH